MQKYQKKLVFSVLMSFFVCASAFAQYVWVDEKGVKQYSDTPPPKSVPNNRILKSPGKASIEAPSQDNAAPAPDADQAPKPVTTASRNEDFMKRKAEQAEKDKKAEEEKRIASQKKTNCERASSYQKSLESGVRIATTDSKGERSYLTDEQRAKELADARRTTADCK
ncbi:DUF4124 domain-containing protein [Undibacterium terreum]|uniref:DUF4124 domain-containing protein n=1 Tax=Undibacterium terreum TaxID=1224302 RepID=A0A916UXL1_9BURK|nr:DUF4124 domain-containing protein [Undibacterium terreum]GGC92865.1 hypothetical protein GCM10011396_45160 [Undibacterium terreum]